MLQALLVLVLTHAFLCSVLPGFVRGTPVGSDSPMPSAHDATTIRNHTTAKRIRYAIDDGHGRVLPPYLLSEKVVNTSDSIKELLQTTRDTYSEMRAFKAQVTHRMNKLEAMVKNSSVPDRIEVLKHEVGGISTSVEKLKESADDLLNKMETSLLAAPGVREKYNSTRTSDEVIQQVSRYKVSWFVSREKIKYMMKLTSPVAYSSNFDIAGYVMRLYLRVTPVRGQLWYGLYSSICPGPKDSLLEWPFRTQRTLTINHAVLKRKSRRTVFGGFISSTGYDKPIKKCNVGIGSAELLAVDDAEKEGFFINDDLHFSIELHPGE